MAPQPKTSLVGWTILSMAFLFTMEVTRYGPRKPLIVHAIEFSVMLLWWFFTTGIESPEIDAKYARDRALVAVRRAIRDHRSAGSSLTVKELEKEWFLRAIADIDVDQRLTFSDEVRENRFVMWIGSILDKMDLAIETGNRNVTESLVWNLGIKAWRLVCEYFAGKRAMIKAFIEKERSEIRERSESFEREKRLRERKEVVSIQDSVIQTNLNGKPTSRNLEEDVRALVALQKRTKQQDVTGGEWEEWSEVVRED